MDQSVRGDRPRPVVSILWKVFCQYRVPFYQKLRENLAARDVCLQFLYGQGKAFDREKGDFGSLEWARPMHDLYIGPFIWQPYLRALRGSDLVIAELANSLLLNYILMFTRRFSRRRFAFWGHGRNFQDKPDSLLNRIKRRYSTNCDWWFAYTEGVKRSLVDRGFPADRVTVVQNAIDTTELAAIRASITEEGRRELRTSLGLGDGPVGIYCGGIYREKMIPFFIDACIKVRKAIPNFHVIVIGSGVDRALVESASQKYPWIHYRGPRFGREKVLHFAVSDLFLMPGLVGLAVLDAFALEVPMVTTDYPFHSPEIEYLESGKSGLITRMEVDDYSSAVVKLLRSPSDLDRMKAHCAAASRKYTIETMAENYARGIFACLGMVGDPSGASGT